MRPARVIRHPNGYWFWLCKIRQSTGYPDPWCIQESLAWSYTGQPAAMDGAAAHLTRHAEDGSLTLTFDAFMRAT